MSKQPLDKLKESEQNTEKAVCRRCRLSPSRAWDKPAGRVSGEDQFHPDTQASSNSKDTLQLSPEAPPPASSSLIGQW
ncbi:hypothetical protein CgunFtcFv8_012853 [Champsocephalus gunnari]|uniref:Uncharacterized protein n=1 Tax=Champsocephalus gunnari TaxID=52237 RepID=A0AAN8HTF6_CHAGU|nr:hypothetical protein CgunFtcFv8_012853 [Champsocephalus gunnari]